MGKDGSVWGRDVPMASMAPGLVLLGWFLMASASALLARAGVPLRPMLMLAELCLLAPGLLAFFALRLGGVSGLGLVGVPRRVFGLSALAGIALWATSLGVFETQYLFWKPPAGYLEAFRRLHEQLRPAGPADALLSVVAIAVGPAVCEELLFRGALLPSLARVLGATAGVVAGALLFGAIHLDFASGPSAYRVPFAIVIGAALGVLRLLTGSVVPPIVAHAVVNTITFLAAPLTDDPSAGLPEPQPLLGFSALAAGGLASAYLIRLLGHGAGRDGRA
jgi:membrane protease YdiL (CAAX protease family)